MNPGRFLQKHWLVDAIVGHHVRRALPHASGRLLDIGCGHRPYLESFKSHVNAYIGLEHLRSVHLFRPDVVGDALRLPFLDGTMDTVVAFQTLEHVPEPATMVREMSRVLRPGGCLILTAPHIWGLHEEPHDYFRFTKYGLRYLLEAAQLTVLEIIPMAGYWVTAGARFCYYLEHFDIGPLKLLTRPTYAIVQGLAYLLDRAHRVEHDAWNYLAVARKPDA